MIKIILQCVLLSTLSLFTSAQDASGTIKVGKAKLHVRTASVGGTFSGALSTRQIIAAGGIDITPAEGAEIIQFELSSAMNGIFQTFNNRGPLFSSVMIDYIGRLPVGSKIYIESIKIQISDSSLQSVNSVYITISKDSVTERFEIYPALAEFAGASSGAYITKTELKKHKYLRLYSNSGDLTVTKFTLHSSMSADTKLSSSSNAVTERMYDLFNNLRKGERLVFDDITAKSTEGKRIQVPPLILKIR